MTTMIGSLATALRTGGNALPRGRDTPAVPGLPTVRLGDRRIPPSMADDDRLEYLLPPCDALFIDSHATSPAALHPGATDRRYLGVAICRIRVRNLSQSAEIALDSPALGNGWWESDARRAGLPLDRRTRRADAARGHAAGRHPGAHIVRPCAGHRGLPAAARRPEPLTLPDGRF